MLRMFIGYCLGSRQVLIILPLVSCCLVSVLLLGLGGVSDKVSIPVLPPILEVPELVYLRRPGELCCGAVGNQKVCFNITGTCPYGLPSKKHSLQLKVL